MSQFSKLFRRNDGTRTPAVRSASAKSLRFEVLEPRLVLTGVAINEFLASNDNGLTDADGDHSDWIELYNSGNELVDLGGWYLTDDHHNLTERQFPSGNLGARDPCPKRRRPNPRGRRE